ncbi:hypothetical protein C1645_837548 [Glomus cerebriforme]|uniref:Uncharacterized protein n=1 Tax=Glomus cerebriforme TaxID=658196 RepID=A0A397SF74_9GLOM|nr:hypothetical protein C1645_837548 [Glomus cerebriforme]
MSLEWNEEETCFLIDEQKNVPTSANTAKTALKPPRVTPSPNISRLITPAVSRPSFRSVTSFFSQNAETINFFINFIEPDEE